MESIHLAYTFERIQDTYALLQGIAMRKRRILQRSEAVASFPRILWSILARAGSFLGLLALTYLLIFYWIARTITPVTPPISPLFFLAGSFLLIILLVISCGVQYRQNLSKFLAGENEGGELVFDDAGLTDICDDGTVTKCLWAELDCCVVTDQLIVFFFGNCMIYLNYSAEAEKTIGEVMTELGKEKLVCRRPIRGSFQINKI